MLFLIIIWFILSVVIGSAASQRGRGAFGWFLLSIFTSPLLAGVLLLLFPPLRDPVLAVDDGALQRSIREGILLERTQKRGVGSWLLAIAVLGTGLALTALGIFRLHERQSATAPAQVVQDPAILAKIEYDGKNQSTLRYGDFVIAVDSEAATGGTGRVPFATGRYKGKTPISIHFDGKDGGQEEPRAELWLMKIDASTTAPQVVFTYFTGGAHCCTATKIATNGADGNWRVVDAGVLDMDGYAFNDLDGDGGRELVSIDNSFLYAFCAYACSNAPTRIKKLVGNDLRDVTSDSRYQNFLRRQLQHMEANARANGEEVLRSNGYLAGWVAAKALVGEFPDAWQKMLTAYDPKSDWTMEECLRPIPLNQCPKAETRQVDFPEALAAHLVTYGYITSKEKGKLVLTLQPVKPAPIAQQTVVHPSMTSPDVARAAMIVDDSGQWAGSIRVDTLKIDSTGKGSAVTCHKGEHGPSCHGWAFDCDRFALLDKTFAHSDYFPPFMQSPNGRSTTPEQNAELQALNAVATKLPAIACRLGGVVLPADNPQWIEVRESSGEVKATIDVAAIRRDADGNAHARVCLNSEPGSTCPVSKVILRWYFNCRTHEYSWLDTTFMPQLPREMNAAQPGSIADKLATLACR
jgi:hypothetical protein